MKINNIKEVILSKDKEEREINQKEKKRVLVVKIILWLVVIIFLITKALFIIYQDDNVVYATGNKNFDEINWNIREFIFRQSHSNDHTYEKDKEWSDAMYKWAEEYAND